MKIIKLQSANFKRLKAIEIVPGNKSTVVVSGKNGQGKSSILDSIFVALAGKGAFDKNDLLKPIREGESKAEITVETEDLIIKRIFKQGKTELEVISKSTGEFIEKSPQSFLDAFLGKLSFDPLEFGSMKADVQKQLLLKLAGVNFGSLEIERKRAYDERHDLGVMLKSYPEKTFDEIAFAEKTVNEGKVDVSVVSQQMREAKNDEDKFTIAQERVKERWVRMQEIGEQMKKLEEEFERVKAEYETFGLVPPSKVTAEELKTMEDKISNASNHNSLVDASQSILNQEKKRMELQKQYSEYTAQIDKIDFDKEKMLTEAKMPIEGLSVTDDGVIFNKIPFHQLSAAEKLKVSMAIAMAMNPVLRVIRIKDGAILDDDSMLAIQEMAKDSDYQLWIETCHNPKDGICLVIEDGSIISNAYEASSVPKL